MQQTITIIDLELDGYERMAELVDTYADFPLGTTDAAVVAVAEQFANYMTHGAGQMMLPTLRQAISFLLNDPVVATLGANRPRRPDWVLSSVPPADQAEIRAR